MTYSTTILPSGSLFSALYKLNVYGFIGYMGYYGYDVSGLDLATIIDNPSSVDWRLFGNALARMSEAFAADVRAIVMGPVKDFAVGFAEVAGVTSLDLAEPKSLAGIAEEVKTLPIVRIAYGS